MSVALWIISLTKGAALHGAVWRNIIVNHVAASCLSPHVIKYAAPISVLNIHFLILLTSVVSYGCSCWCQWCLCWLGSSNGVKVKLLLSGRCRDSLWFQIQAGSTEYLQPLNDLAPVRPWNEKIFPRLIRTGRRSSEPAVVVVVVVVVCGVSDVQSLTVWML